MEENQMENVNCETSLTQNEPVQSKYTNIAILVLISTPTYKIHTQMKAQHTQILPKSLGTKFS